MRFIHTLDYDEVIALGPSLPGRDIDALYIDSMGPLHPDFAVSDVPVLVDPVQWFEEVNRGLSAFERHTGTRVSVAPHPRSRRADVAEWYGGRQVVSVGTPEAIARSRVIIATSGSTSLGLAAALATPAIAMRTTGIHRMHQPELESYRQALDLPYVDATAESISWPAVRLNPDRYESFVSEYIKRPGTPNTPFWEQVVEDIKELPGR